MSFENGGYDYHAVVSSFVALQCNAKWAKDFGQENLTKIGE